MTQTQDSTQTAAADTPVAVETPPAQSPAPAAPASPETPADAVQVQQVEPAEAVDSGIRTAGGQIGLLLDTIVHVSVSLGTVEAEIRELLQLGPGAVLKLDKLVGEPVDLFLRGIRFATGNLVVVGDRMGVRIKEVLPAPVEA